MPGSSDDTEGDFISLRNKFNWGVGNYRLSLIAGETVPGKPVPENFSPKDLYFSWGEYEQTFVTMQVENLKTHEKKIIGSLAFPGKSLEFGQTFALFEEQYFYIFNFKKGRKIDVPYSVMDYDKIPRTKIVYRNLMVDGKPMKIKDVNAQMNRTHNPDQDKIKMPIPILSTLKFDKNKNVIETETGKLVKW